MTGVLVIDDEEPIRANLMRLLRLEGFEVFSAADGMSGIELAGKVKPQAILCDIVMPGVDGYQVLARLRADPTTAGIPFIFLTASADSKERELCLARGAQAYVTKPFSLKEVMEAVRACVAL